MSVVHLKMSDPTVRDIIRTTFPDYNGKNVTARIQETVVLYGTMWDDGSKREYKLLRLSDMRVIDIEDAPYMETSRLHEAEIKMEPGLVVVCLNHFRGTKRLEIISSAENITPMLSAPNDLTEDEKTVLVATRSLKSSYAGIKDYRFLEAKRRRGITRERWDEAMNLLKSKKYLSSSGAITVDGRNAVGMESL